MIRYNSPMKDDADPKAKSLSQSWAKFKTRVSDIKARTRKLLSDAEKEKQTRVLADIKKRISDL